MSTLLDGRAVAQRIRRTVAKQAERLTAGGITPCVAVILMGGNPASEVYVRNKQRACHEAGITFRLIRLAEDVAEGAVLEAIDGVNADPEVHGLLVQLPLPPQVSENRCIDAIDPAKDVDGFHPLNAGLVARGEAALAPCTPLGVMRLLAESGIQVAGKHAVVVGRGAVGRPLASMLVRADATVTVCHSKTRDVAAHTREAELLFACAGVPKMIRADMVRPGAVVVDVGIHRLESGRLCGDVDFAAVQPVAAAITPVPGGVGPMTVAMLLANTVQAARGLNPRAGGG